jgi:hypothetical protein
VRDKNRKTANDSYKRNNNKMLKSPKDKALKELQDPVANSSDYIDR